MDFKGLNIVSQDNSAIKVTERSSKNDKYAKQAIVSPTTGQFRFGETFLEKIGATAGMGALVLPNRIEDKDLGILHLVIVATPKVTDISISEEEYAKLKGKLRSAYRKTEKGIFKISYTLETNNEDLGAVDITLSKINNKGEFTCNGAWNKIGGDDKWYNEDGTKVIKSETLKVGEPYSRKFTILSLVEKGGKPVSGLFQGVPAFVVKSTGTGMITGTKKKAKEVTKETVEESK